MVAGEGTLRMSGTALTLSREDLFEHAEEKTGPADAQPAHCAQKRIRRTIAIVAVAAAAV